MVATLAYLPFRVVYAPTRWVGRVVAWLAQGYREGTSVEQVLILPSWAILRGAFIRGWCSPSCSTASRAVRSSG